MEYVIRCHSVAQWLEVMQFKEIRTPTHWYNSNKNNDYIEDEKSNEEENAYIGSIYIEEAGLLLRFTHVRLAIVFGIQTWNTWRWHSEFSEQRVKNEAKQFFALFNSKAQRLWKIVNQNSFTVLSNRNLCVWEKNKKLIVSTVKMVAN